MIKSVYSFKRFVVIFSSVVLLSSVFYLGYSYGKSVPAGTNQISLQDAQRFTNNYHKSSAVVPSGTINALVIDLPQYNAMTQVLQNSVGSTGFRLYYGVNDNNESVRIVAGIGANGHDNTNYLILTSASGSGLCPPVCDNPSGTLGE